MTYDKGNAKDLAVIRSVAIVGLLLESLGCGLYVLFQRTKDASHPVTTSTWQHRMLSLANAFSGGLFLALGLIHILPESAESSGKVFGETEDRYRLAFVVAGGAYLLLLFLQRIVAAPAEQSAAPCSTTNNSAVFMKQHSGDAVQNSSMGDSHCVHNGCVEGPEHIRHSTRASDALVRAVIGNEAHTASEGHVEAGQSNGASPSAESPLLSHPTEAATSAFSEEGLKAVVLMAALSIHSVAAGMALGLEPSTHGALTLLFAMLMHKWAAAIALGTSFSTAVPVAVSRTAAAITIACFSCTTPVGVVIGWIASDTLPAEVNSILMAFTAGTFLYLSSEIGTDEFISGGHYVKKYVAYIAAFGLVYAVTAWAG